jgi:2,4-dienoyl-CoA reductase-like NADH-dependent reductase (Old Yellow Enzyme family)
MTASSTTTARLFEPIVLRSTTARNRLWVAPMCQYSAIDGVVGDWHLVHLGQFAIGGAGVVMAEATGVVADGRITPDCPGIYNDEQAAAWAPVAAFIRRHGALAGIQLAHAGRKASTYRPWGPHRGSVPEEDGGWETVAPSAISHDGLALPRELTAAGIHDVIEAFRDAARRAIDAGFDLVEVHAAHGYLLHQFLSPLSNRRTDEWGGSLEHRARIMLDTVRAVREEVGDDVPVLVRLSARDWREGGLTPEDVGVVAGWAVEAGADLVDLTTGGITHDLEPDEPGYELPDSAIVKAISGAVTAAVGRIDTAELAEEVVATGTADVVMSAREFLRDPHFALRAADELGVPYREIWPQQYERASRLRRVRS